MGSSQYLAQILGASSGLIISGSTVMIVTTVSIETLQQIEARWKIQSIHNKEKNKTKNYNQEMLMDDLNLNNRSQDTGSILW